ncbi:uncharacterized protein M6B38_184870 [Iris pallida]|uniref:DUF3741 domain-containing protein n=1 Tax=Iris pallida TaxID=29817 RepID=A0AAX6ELK1_IRIPA|nr:uncharacterized protein M6B38_184870 [Iris pallida]
MDHHRLQQQQQKSKHIGGLGRKTIGVPPHLSPARRADVEGNDQFRRRINYSKITSDSSSSNGSCIEEKSFTSDSQQRKACGRPIKALIHEEMLREKETRRSSPSVIAKLMGLDTLPPAQVLDKQQKDMRSYSRRTTYAEDISHRRRNSEQEFKDVFEIKDSLKVEKNRNQPPGAPWSKRNETDVAFIKQKFMEAKRLSTDETLQNSKEFNDALEVLDSNKDLFLQFLQEPNSLFTKHLNDLKCFSPSPRESRITILRSSKGKKHEMGESSSSSEAKVESSGYLHNDAVSSCRKPINGLVNPSLTENGLSLSHKLLMSRTANKTKSSSHPTKIVVLNPSLEKAQNLARIVSPTISHENHQYGFTRHRGFRQSGVKELHAEGRERQKLFDNLEVMGHKAKGSREIAREITKQMKRSLSSSGQMPFSGSDNLCAMSGRYSSNKFEAYQWDPDFDYRSSCSSSSSCSTESTVSKEARKSLSERWRMAHRLREARLIRRGSNTLSEMLALSDRGTSRETLMSKKVSDEKSARGSLGTRFYPSGISSRDGWKGGCSKHLSRSSLSSPSTTHGTPNLSSSQHIGVNDRCYMLKMFLIWEQMVHYLGN